MINNNDDLDRTAELPTFPEDPIFPDDPVDIDEEPVKHNSFETIKKEVDAIQEDSDFDLSMYIKDEEPVAQNESTGLPKADWSMDFFGNTNTEETPQEEYEEPKQEVKKPKKKSNNNKKKQEPKKEEKNIFKKEWSKDPFVLNVVVTIGTVILNLLIAIVLFNTTRFASISTNIFLYLNLGILIALILVDLLVILMIRTKKIFLFVISAIIVSLLVGVGGYSFYALGRVNKSVTNITSETKEETVSASLVIYTASSGSPITDISDLEGKKVGIATDTTTAEIAQKRLKSENINVDYVELSGYTNVLSELIAGNIDCAVLPATYQSQFEDDENLANYLTDTQSILDFSDTVVSTGEAGADKDITKEPFTVLVTGENQGLADTIILMSVNPISMKVTMTSIARDSYVPISCYGSSDKINSAHASSESCMVQTVENLTGVDIDYTIEFNFASVVQVVDAVGGVDVDVETSFYAQCWNVERDELEVIYIEQGDNQHLDGERALGFARERMAFADGDFARQRHQQEIIEQVVEKLMQSKDPQMFLDILDAAGENIKTNFTVNQMTSFINYALKKANRYWDQTSMSGLFNFVTSRIYGYSAGLWNESLELELYIYRLFNGSIADNVAAIERNMDLDADITSPDDVSWSAADGYTPDPISQEWYNEAQITDSGKPEETEDPDATDDPDATTDPSATTDPNETPSATEEPSGPAEIPTEDPANEPTIEPTPDTGESTPSPDPNTNVEPAASGTVTDTPEGQPE